MQRELDTAMGHRPQAAHTPLLEAEVGRLRVRITKLEREKADAEAFAAMAVHELLAPLVMIDTYAAMVSERVDEDSLRDLDALRRGVLRTRLLVDTLLEHARCHGRPLRPRPIDVNLVVRECLTLLAPEIHSRGAEPPRG